ncbi:Sulfotransferase 1C2A [Nymphon striatum]|nr:Sulfotransferase 1C2A [Nymphon striatum]KAG1683815.1 Sulfotransferase 1C2A [Nymphon striatum]
MADLESSSIFLFRHLEGSEEEEIIDTKDSAEERTSNLSYSNSVLIHAQTPQTEKPNYKFVESLGIIRPVDLLYFEEASKFYPADEDVIVATYPKCGTTWTQSILWLLTHNLQKCPDMDMLIFGRFLEFIGKEGANKVIDELRILKTHLPLNLFQWNPKTKYIVVVRNPFDCVVSFYHHTKAFLMYGFADGTFDTYFELFMKGEVDWGDYFQHLVSWYKVKDEANVLFLLFEDMKSDLQPVLKKIGKFLGGKYAGMVDNDEVIANIIEGVSIKKMHNMPVANLQGDFFRKGVIGDWKNYFDDEKTKRLNQKFNEYDEKYGIRQIWKEYEDILPAKTKD